MRIWPSWSEISMMLRRKSVSSALPLSYLIINIHAVSFARRARRHYCRSITQCDDDVKYEGLFYCCSRERTASTAVAPGGPAERHPILFLFLSFHGGKPPNPRPRCARNSGEKHTAVEAAQYRLEIILR
jgi:hypothetical protein